MGVAPATELEVHGDRRRVCEGAPELLGQLNVERRVPEWRRLAQSDVVVQIRPAGEVECHVDQRFVERHRDRREAANAGLRPERLAERLTEDDARVLDRVMSVDLQISPSPNLKIQAAVTAELGQHVVEERQTGGGYRFARAVELDDHGHFGLSCRSPTLGAALGRCPMS